MRYLTFDLAIERIGNTGYRSRVIDAPAGQADEGFRLPFFAEELGRVADWQASGWVGPEFTPQDFGSRLFTSLFVGRVRDVWQQSLARSQQEGAGLRLNLRLDDVPELAALPWELLYDPSHERFLALAEETPVVRYLALSLPEPPLIPALPLRCLLVEGHPGEEEPLDFASEWSALRQELDTATRRGQVVLERLVVSDGESTLDALARRLLAKDVHLLHFVGHGRFDGESGAGVLVGVDEAGDAEDIPAVRLGQILHNCPSLRLVYLNACEGALTGVENPFTGVAQKLVQQGIPAVIAMQGLVADGSAQRMAARFYASLATAAPVDAALAQARTAVDPRYTLDWAWPVLFSRSPQNQLVTPPAHKPQGELLRLEESYRDFVISLFKDLAFRSLASAGKPLTLQLEDVFVELKSVAQAPAWLERYNADERRLMEQGDGEPTQGEKGAGRHLDALRLERYRVDARQAGSGLVRRSIGELLSAEGEKGLVILGDPGSGKSTLLRYLALTAARQPAGSALPIFLPLAAHDSYRRSNPGVGLADFFALYYAQNYSQPGLGPLFAQALEEGRALVLLDGLDEVNDQPTRVQVTQQVSGLIRRWQAQGNRFAVTSRVVGYSEAPLPSAMHHVTVLDFGRAEIAQFAGKWCRAYEAWQAGESGPEVDRLAAAEERALLDEVGSNPSVERLAANPLLLTMLAILRRQQGRLPRGRVELYERYVDVFLNTWQDERSPGARPRDPDRFDANEAEQYLAEIALWLHCQPSRITASRQEVLDELTDIRLRYLHLDGWQAVAAKERIEARSHVQRFLAQMERAAGLLAPRGQDAYGFLHLTFQEYFAALALSQQSDPALLWEILAAHLHNPKWREVLLLCAGKLGRDGRRGRGLVNQLLDQIVAAGSEHEALLHRDLLLAADLAVEEVGLTPERLADLTERLIPLLTSPIPSLRRASTQTLARLGLESGERALLTRLADDQHKQEAIRFLAPLLGESAFPALRRAIHQALSDKDEDVRRAAVQALAPLVGSDAEARQAIHQALSDDSVSVRSAAVQALAPLVGSDAELSSLLLSWLGAWTEYGSPVANVHLSYGDQIRLALIPDFARAIEQGSVGLGDVAALLDSPVGQARAGAVQVLLALADGPPAHLLPKIRAILSDRRGEESWPNRLQAVEILVNHRDKAISQRAVQTALTALDFATQPWYDLPRFGQQVRSQAAAILGQLEPIYQDPAVIERLVRLLQQDKDEAVRDSAYAALLRLLAAPEERDDNMTGERE